MVTARQNNARVAKELRVSVRWLRGWRGGGEQLLRSRGSLGRPRLSGEVKGPVALGWKGQKWALVRIRTLIGRRFHKSLTSRPSRRCCIATG